MKKLALVLLLLAMAPAAAQDKKADAKRGRAAKAAAKACAAWLAARHPDRLFVKSTDRPSFDTLREREAVAVILSVAPDRFRDQVTPQRLLEEMRVDGVDGPAWALRPLGIKAHKIVSTVAHADAVTVTAAVDYFGEMRPEVIRTVWVLEGRRWCLSLRVCPGRINDPWARTLQGPTPGDRIVELPPELDPRTGNELAVAIEELIEDGATQAMVAEELVGARVQDVVEVLQAGVDEEGRGWVHVHAGWVRLRFWWPADRVGELKVGDVALLAATVNGVNGEQPWIYYEQTVEGRQGTVSVLDVPVESVALRVIDQAK